MNIVLCPGCQMRVVPTAENTCPSCRQIIPQAASPGQGVNPFADSLARPPNVAGGTRNNLNPYASSSLIETKGNPLVAPATILLLGSVLWLFMVLFVAGRLILTKGLLARLGDPEVVGQLFAYFVFVLLPIVTMAGAISMINRQSKQTAWADALVALIPVCGPCYGLLIPFAIWALVLMRRADVTREFRS